MTLFWFKEDFENSTNKGFLILDKEKFICRVREEDGQITEYTLGDKNVISEEMENIIRACIEKYSYMIKKPKTKRKAMRKYGKEQRTIKVWFVYRIL